jgi:superfamily II DNA helicase RecQ
MDSHSNDDTAPSELSQELQAARADLHSTKDSPERYAQEAGRAGRDGMPADCILFYRLEDVRRSSIWNAFRPGGQLKGSHAFSVRKYVPLTLHQQTRW